MMFYPALLQKCSCTSTHIPNYTHCIINITIFLCMKLNAHVVLTVMLKCYIN